MKKTFRFIDLFAGIGGFHRALSRLGGECVLAVEIDEDCRKVYEASFPEFDAQNKLKENIREITRGLDNIDDQNFSRDEQDIAKDVPDHDVLCAGFPCQPFSIAGKGLGFSDATRGTLFFDIIQIIKAKKPRYVLLENVRNIAGKRHASTWKTIINSLRELGYSVPEDPLIISPHNLIRSEGGAPQVRDRVFITATKDEIDIVQPKSAFSETKENLFYWKIDKYLLPDSKIKNINNYRLRNEEKIWFKAWNYFVENLPSDYMPTPIWVDSLDEVAKINEDMADWRKQYLRKNSEFYNNKKNKKFIDRWLTIDWDPNNELGFKGITVKDFPESRRKFEFQARKMKKNEFKGGKRSIRPLVMQLRQSGLRVKPANYLPALVAITQTSIVGPDVKKGIEDYRRITPYEAAKLQGIEDGDVFCRAGVNDSAAYKQLGNGVNVGVVEYVARNFLDKSILADT